MRDEAAIARELGRSLPSVRKHARKLFGDEIHTGPWSDEEVARLKHYLGATRLETVAQVLGRSLEDIRAKLVQLAIDVTDAPLEGDARLEFKRVYGTRADEDLSIVFGRRLDVIRNLAAELCLSKDKAFVRRESRGRDATRMPRWTKAELAQLADLYPETANLEIARILGRSVKSVVSKAHHLGLHKTTVRLQEMGRENVAIRHQRRDESREGHPSAGDGGRVGDGGAGASVQSEERP
ncbi:MAG: hypothetical protein R3F49_03940 [Planctomycetota bacterium]